MPVSEYGHDDAARDRAMRDRLLGAGVRLVVCAGYNRILSDEFLAAFPDAILNVHPSLLPAFGGGMHAVEDALEQGVKLTGCTVQLLEPGLPDGGAIVLQRAVPGPRRGRRRAACANGSTREEWVALPEAVRLWCEGRIRREGRVLRIDPPAAVAGGRPPQAESSP